MESSRILFQLSGSIACFKSCSVISKLVQDGHEVKTLCTRGALRFMGAATLEGLSGNPVIIDTFERGNLMDHIHVTKWADLTVLAPASASSINRLASGRGDDVLGTFFLASDLRKPYLVAPAMNQQMFIHPSVQESMKTLSKWGVKILSTGEGPQACGDWGPGRMLEAEELYKIISQALSEPGSKRTDLWKS